MDLTNHQLHCNQSTKDCWQYAVHSVILAFQLMTTRTKPRTRPRGQGQTLTSLAVLQDFRV